MKFSLKDASEFGWEGLKGRGISSREDFPNASAAYFEVTGEHGMVKSKLSDRVYFVLGGSGKFVIGKESIRVTLGDVIIVPRDTPYNYRALTGSTLKLFLVHTPAYDPTKEIKL